MALESAQRCPWLVFTPQAASSSFTSPISELAEGSEGSSWTWIFAALKRDLGKAEQILRRFARPQASRLLWNHNWRKPLRSQGLRRGGTCPLSHSAAGLLRLDPELCSLMHRRLREKG